MYTHGLSHPYTNRIGCPQINILRSHPCFQVSPIRHVYLAHWSGLTLPEVIVFQPRALIIKLITSTSQRIPLPSYYGQGVNHYQTDSVPAISFSTHRLHFQFWEKHREFTQHHHEMLDEIVLVAAKRALLGLLRHVWICLHKAKVTSSGPAGESRTERGEEAPKFILAMILPLQGYSSTTAYCPGRVLPWLRILLDVRSWWATPFLLSRGNQVRIFKFLIQCRWSVVQRLDSFVSQPGDVWGKGKVTRFLQSLNFMRLIVTRSVHLSI